jgi:hypothetical protein
MKNDSLLVDDGRAHPVPQKSAVVDDFAAQARREFELVPDEFRAGTSKLYSRGDFLPLDDPKAMSEGDFVGRLRALFGPRTGDEYVLRHRATGLIITAYAAQSGPSYGGGSDSDARIARLQADPVLAAGPAVDWSKYDLQKLPAAELKLLREQERQWHRRLQDVSAPPGFAAVVTRLDQLVSLVTPADWEVLRYWGEDPSVSRVGVRRGEAFQEELPAAEALTHLLSAAEQKTPPLKDTAGDAGSGADHRVVSYWVYQAERGTRVEAVLPRVQAAWFRSVAQVQREEAGKLRELLLEQAKREVGPLGIDLQKADAALRPGP